MPRNDDGHLRGLRRISGRLEDILSPDIDKTLRPDALRVVAPVDPEQRLAIEAYSRTAKLDGLENASACGLNLVGAKYRVTDASNVIAQYFVDRLD